MSNPLLSQTDLPQYKSIKPEHITPAVDHYIEHCQKQLDHLISVRTPTYTHLIDASHKILEPYNKAWAVVGHLKSVVSNDQLRDAYNENLPKVTEFFTNLSQNKEFYNAYKHIDKSQCRPDQAKALENALINFELSGVALEGKKRNRCKTIFSELSALRSKFSDAVLDATMAWTKSIDDVNILKGVPEGALGLLAQNAQQRGQEGHLLTLEFPSYLPIMLYAEDRELRKEICLPE